MKLPHKITTAMILAAGLGTRMRPLTDSLPKPLVEVQGRALIDRKIDLLVKLGFTKIVINVFYLADMLTEHLAKRDDVEIIISREEERLETGGGVLNALPLLGDEPVLITSSDVIYEDESGLARLLEVYNSGMKGTLLLHKTADAWGYDGTGDFDLDYWKIYWKKEESAEWVFTTSQILRPEIFKDKRVNEFGKVFSLRKIYDLFLPEFCGVENVCDWYHVGTPEAVAKLNENTIKLL